MIRGPWGQFKIPFFFKKKLFTKQSVWHANKKKKKVLIYPQGEEESAITREEYDVIEGVPISSYTLLLLKSSCVFHKYHYYASWKPSSSSTSRRTAGDKREMAQRQ